MRYLNFAGRFCRLCTIVLCAAALHCLTLAGPAAAQAHSHHFARDFAYRQTGRYYAPHFVRRHYVQPMQAADFALNSGQTNSWQPSAWQSNSWQTNAWRPNVAAETGWRQRRWSQNEPNGNSWGRGTFNQPSAVDGMAAAQASAAGIPVSLVERVIRRESGGNPRAVSRGNYGLMQIRLGTARAMGYSGSAAGLLDPTTNMTYAVRYLAGAYRAAGGNENRAVALYASGYYYQAKAQGFSPYANAGPSTAFGMRQPFVSPARRHRRRSV